MVSLVQQLNAIRNEKAKKRREQVTRRRAESDKKKAKDEVWKNELKKEEKKKKHIELDRAKRKAENAAMGKYAKKKRKSADE